MSSDSENINYAMAFGFNSVPAAAIFAGLYTPLFCFFLFKIIRERRGILITLLAFCLFRIVGFVMRAIAASNTTIGQNAGYVVATQTFFSVGFFGLLFCAYLLVVARFELCTTKPSSSPFIRALQRIIRQPWAFRVCMTAPMALGIAGLDESVEHPEDNLGVNLRKASAVLFLVLTLFQVIQTGALIKAEHEDRDSLKYTSPSFGGRHASWIFGCISILLLIREIFTTATINSFSKANNEHFWYPLVAVPELLCVILYLIPGVVPPKIKDKSEPSDVVMK
ncbi:hypothetical protein GGU11DRAFT_728459 [Lentinula aff. detonsa]|uniref:RTA1-domain-containing protein n=1 Tax=Lentinula aff. detonsa TaxID=2804958 RepID=A0AA38KL06_9AGAR|nr:hypothetical protein GGU10DRAFT_300282 [Lentinula aff. detonsa]KAJ3795506.1 hypothetical protein GGU11DRAFT_728459 [Lentinula aff. detonsa]